MALLWCLAALPAQAHEVLPAIADMTREGDELVFDISLNAESFIAGIDLTETNDTDNTPQAADYDEVRALEPAALEAAFADFWPQMAQQIQIIADGEALTPDLISFDAGEVGNVDLVRTSTVSFKTELPEGVEKVSVGWAREFGTLVLRQQGVDAPYDGYLEAGSMSDEIDLGGGDQAGAWQTFVNYIPVGFDHIVPKGLDHILFVLGLFFLSTHLRPLIWQVSLFTVAHTITLALAALGYTNFMDEFFISTFGIEFIAVVEPLIALSIVYVAVENIFMRNLSPWRPVIVFLFGLLHGLGFASVLSEFGLPDNAFVPALIGFNIGVEIGQLAVIAVMFLAVWQAIRVDRGENEVFQAKALYGVLMLVTLALLWLDPTALSEALENPSYVFLAPMLAIFALCFASISFRDHLAAFRRTVAIPASVFIALVGAYWFLERTVL
ncbi:HupE/UreJ family protein [Yoonia sp. 208BN28-4]|uniref:HupE/UreJ family protein n=1 Tax=Yoonia sp. 208BN28-4 TaxID=3126505 RepID=UPI00309500D3